MSLGRRRTLAIPGWRAPASRHPRGGVHTGDFDAVRAVRVGVQTTVLTLVALAGFSLLPGHGHVATAPFVVVWVLAACAVPVIARLPWARLFATRAGWWAMYAWSIADILLISVAVYATGGGHSELWVAYGLTTLFFAALYPSRVQARFLAFTIAAYVVTVALSHWETTPARFFLHLAILVVIFTMAMFLALERDEALLRLAHQAHHDPQTGVLRRQAFMRVLERTLAADAVRSPVALLFIDIDRFKWINDAHGHHVGDEIIEVVAERLCGAVRADDVIARFGGDEFVVLCPFADETQVHEIASRVVADVAQPVIVSGHRIDPTVSVGVACNAAGHPTTADELLRRSDHAMYQAKHDGRARAAFA
jgi:diguanylate cyclase (GGDEF)-like protein